MSEYQTKDFTGSLFANDRKEKDTDPNAKGTAVIDGVEYWVSAWTNTSAKGVRYQSLKFTAKQEAHAQGMAQAKQAAEPAFEDTDIPFSNYEYRTFA